MKKRVVTSLNVTDMLRKSIIPGLANRVPLLGGLPHGNILELEPTRLVSLRPIWSIPSLSPQPSEQVEKFGQGGVVVALVIHADLAGPSTSLLD